MLPALYVITSVSDDTYVTPAVAGYLILEGIVSSLKSSKSLSDNVINLVPSESFWIECPSELATPSVYSTFDVIWYVAVRELIPSPSAVLTLRLVLPPPTILSVTLAPEDDTFSTTPSLERLPVLSLSVSTNILLVSLALDAISIISPT